MDASLNKLIYRMIEAYDYLRLLTQTRNLVWIHDARSFCF